MMNKIINNRSQVSHSGYRIPTV